MENQEELDAFIESETEKMKLELKAETKRFQNFFLDNSTLKSNKIIPKSSASQFEVLDDGVKSEKISKTGRKSPGGPWATTYYSENA